MKDLFFLFKLEWLKYKNNRVFQFVVLAFVICQATLILVGQVFKSLPPPLPSNKVFYQFPTVWEYQAYIGNWLAFIFIGFLAIYFITNEFNQRTLRQNIIYGIHRHQFFLAKFIFALIISIGAAFTYILICIGYGILNTPDITLPLLMENTNLIPRYFLMVFAYMTFGYFIGYLMQKPGLAIFIYLAYVLFMEPILRWALHFKLWKHRSSLYYPMNAIEDLTPNPLQKLTVNIPDLPFSLFLSPVEAIIITLFYLLIFTGISYRLIIMKDL